MSIEIKVPVFAESVTEASLLNWHKKTGDSVTRGESLIDIETDKVTLELSAPCDGKLLKIIKQDGAIVKSEEVIAIIDDSKETSDPAKVNDTANETVEDNAQPAAKLSPAVKSMLAENELKAGDIKTTQQPERLTKADVLNHLAAAINNTSSLVPAPTEHTDTPEPPDSTAKTDTAAAATDDSTTTTDTAAAAIDDSTTTTDTSAAAIDNPPTTTDTSAAAIDNPPTTTDTSAAATDNPPITTDASAAATDNPPITTDTSAAATDNPPITTDASAAATDDYHKITITNTENVKQTSPLDTNPQRPKRRVAMTRLRKYAAERLLSAQHEHAILTTFNEVNMQSVIELRQNYKQKFEETHHVKLGFMSFFTLAAVAALKRFPIINAMVDGEDIIYHDFFDIGIAIGTKRGILVPILRDADKLSHADIELSIRKFAEKTDQGKLTIEDMTGGTFTITNGGVFGSLLSTPIINPPQSAILGMHTIQQRPVVKNDQIIIQPMMYLALSYDHRIIDGREAVQFLVSIKENIEDPLRFLLQI